MTTDAHPKSTQDSGSQASCLTLVRTKGMAHTGVRKKAKTSSTEENQERWGFSGKAKKHLTVGRIPRKDGRVNTQLCLKGF